MYYPNATLVCHLDEFKLIQIFKHLFTGIAARLLGCRDVRIYHDLTFFKESTKNHGSDTPWHQDGHYWQVIVSFGYSAGC